MNLLHDITEKKMRPHKKRNSQINKPVKKGEINVSLMDFKEPDEEDTKTRKIDVGVQMLCDTTSDED